MSSVKPLPVAELYHACDPEDLPFLTTADLEELGETIGQGRALEAIDFGVGIRHEGYNLFVLGSIGLGKHTVVREELERRAEKGAVPSDWCYVNDFDHPHKPRALQLPAGWGAKLQDDMTQLVEDLRNAIPAAFRSDEYRTRAQEINDELKERQEKAFSDLDDKAKERGITMLRTPTGYTLAPVRDGEIVGPEEFEKLSKEDQQEVERAIDELREELKETLRQIPVWQKETRQRFKQLNQEVSELTVDQLIGSLEQHYKTLPDVLEYITAIKGDVIDNVDDFRKGEEEEDVVLVGLGGAHPGRQQDFTRYRVNVLVDNSKTSGAPVIYEDNPTYLNLVGRVEHRAQLGTLLTDFTLIKPGALHRANGGYLVLDVRKVILSPFAWEGLKRALSSHEVRIESLEQMLSMVSTISLEPEPIPIDVKLVLTGDRLLYYLLKQYDPEFARLFKVAADFAEDMDRSAENTLLYARLIAGLQRREELRAFDRDGVARVLEACARRAEDSEKFSLHMGSLLDLMREADYWAGEGGSDVVRAQDVQRAIDTQIHRQDQIRERIHESIQRGIQMIDTEGAQVAQVNGLSVIQLGDYAFGRPSRITATARLGEGKVIDIEREVELGGSIHSKGVLILSSYLAERYARKRPLSLSASLVFEQSYGMVEGDSASVAELCALLSALGDIPIKQGLALTGSVNQLGQVQPIGGVNEKIEGFFDVCNARGLTGEQGVIIPQSNVAHLMLRRDVVEACEQGRFHIYPVTEVGQVMGLLTGLAPGEADAVGNYPADSVNGRVQQRLEEFTQLRLEFAAEAKGESNSGDA